MLSFFTKSFARSNIFSFPSKKTCRTTLEKSEHWNLRRTEKLSNWETVVSVRKDNSPFFGSLKSVMTSLRDPFNKLSMNPLNTPGLNHLNPLNESILFCILHDSITYRQFQNIFSDFRNGNSYNLSVNTKFTFKTSRKAKKTFIDISSTFAMNLFWINHEDLSFWKPFQKKIH